MDKLIFEFVVQMATKLGYAANQAWPMMVQYTWALGISKIACGVLVGLFGYGVGYWGMRHTSDTAEYGLGVCVGVFTVLFGIIFACANIPDVLAPEGATIMNMVQTMKR